MAIISNTMISLAVFMSGFALVSGFIVDTFIHKNYSCTFEGNSCGYKVSSTSGLFRWTYISVSSLTRPFPTDHTLNIDGHGHEFNLRSTGSNKVGDKTKIQSQKITGYLGPTTIEFWYSTSGTGPVVMDFSVSSQTNDKSVLLFKRSVQDIVPWTHVCAVKDVLGPIELVFESKILHSGLTGELSIDDITVRAGSHCKNTHIPIIVPPHAVETVSCNFDSSSCGYTNVKAPRDNFDWVRHHGATVSTATGPSKDHTTGHGYYMYIETSSPRKPGEHALIESPTFFTYVSQHLIFWYHSYGSTTGALRVYTEHGTSLGQPLFELAHKSATGWQYSCIDIPAKRLVTRIVFEGVVGSGYQGDIAIDDVSLGKGVCPPVNGHWGSWSSNHASSCSVTCGTGHWTSRRSCNHPAPSNGGHTCPGSPTKTVTCQRPTCPTWTHWFSESCSVTCGNGTMLRIRHCSSGNDVHCGGVATEKMPCNEGNCPVNGNWGAWSSYSTCSVTCGNGNMTSTRTCDSPAPVHGGNDCHGDAIRMKSCHHAPCKVDGDWSVWTSWSSCSASCNTGTRSRLRACDHPPPTHGGLDCKGSNNETENCNVVKCPEWTGWFYGKCHVTCGIGNTTRIRHCSTGNDADCGNGSSMETVACDGGPCPVDGGWGVWETWGVCSQTCGNGTRDRHRKCDDPAPQNGGRECSGFGKGTGTCYLVECPYWLPFEQISACSVTCGRGFASLKRNCSTGIPSDCTGSPYDEHTCILSDCV